MLAVAPRCSARSNFQTAWRVLLVLAFLGFGVIHPAQSQTPPWPPGPGGHWPEAGGGDTTVASYQTTPSDTSAGSDFAKAVDQVAIVDPQMAQEIRTAVEQGAVGVAQLQDPEGSSFVGLIQTYPNSNTGATLVQNTSYSVNARAANLVHEWTHLRARSAAPAGQPAPPHNGPCDECDCFQKQLAFMNSVSCDTVPYKPINCDDWERVRGNVLRTRANCNAANGTLPPIPPGFPTGSDPACACVCW